MFNFCPNTTDPQLVGVSSKDNAQREFHCCTSSYGQSESLLSDSDNSPVKGHLYFAAVSWPAEKTSLVDEGWFRLTAIHNFCVLNIQTQHSQFWGFEADKTFTISWSGCRVQVWAQVWAPAGHLAITPKSYSRRQCNVLTAKSNVELLRQRASTAWAVWMGKHKHRVFPSLLQSLQAATGSLEENVLPLLQYSLIFQTLAKVHFLYWKLGVNRSIKYKTK